MIYSLNGSNISISWKFPINKISIIDNELEKLGYIYDSVYNGFGDELFDYEKHFKKVKMLNQIKQYLQEIDKLQNEINQL